MTERDERPDDAQTDPDVDIDLIDEMLRMSPWERLRQNDRMAALAVKLRAAFLAREEEWKDRAI